MAKNKKKRNKKASPQIIPMKPEKYIKEHARKSPVYQCLIADNWVEEMFSPIIVSRQKPNGHFILGSYIVDLQCLGVKNANYEHDLGREEYQEQLEMYARGMGNNFVQIDPNLCFNIIYAAVEFAEDCGFQPHRDFSVAKYILDDVDALEYVEVPVGKGGKPFFVAGPYDNVDRILATLKRHVGEGNFDYLAGVGLE